MRDAREVRVGIRIERERIEPEKEELAKREETHNVLQDSYSFASKGEGETERVRGREEERGTSKAKGRERPKHSIERARRGDASLVGTRSVPVSNLVGCLEPLR